MITFFNLIALKAPVNNITYAGERSISHKKSSKEMMTMRNFAGTTIIYLSTKGK
jgi:hypothetical protein